MGREREFRERETRGRAMESASGGAAESPRHDDSLETRGLDLRELLLRVGARVDRPDLDADWRHQHKPSDRRGAFGGDLRSGPAADRMAEQRNPGQAQPVDEFEVEVCEIVDGIQPERQA